MLEQMPRRIYDADHELFREAAREFVQREVVPHAADWELEGAMPRSFWKAAGAAGLLGLSVPEEFGGGGAPDIRFGMVLNEEIARCGHASVAVGMSVHNDLVVPYFLELGTEEQKRRWLPGVCTGESVLAVAMTEPGTGSDLGAIRTTARQTDDGWRLDGAKTFISNGTTADVVVVAARTEDRPGGLSLFVVERGTPGFGTGRRLEKVGLHAQDTAELSFDDVALPARNLLGERGKGQHYLRRFLVRERLATALGAVNHAENYLSWTLDYTSDRKAFGRPVNTFQHNTFALVEMATELQIARTFVDRCVESLLDGTLTGEQTAMAKWWCTELRLRVVDRCLQLHGGYGYMLEYPIARAYVDSRVETIYAGTTEIMKEIIGRGLLPQR